MVAPQYTLCVIDVFVCIYQHSSVRVCKSICCCCCPSDPAGVRTRVWARCLLGLALTNPMILNRIEEEKESLSAASGLFTTEDNLHVFNALPHPCFKLKGIYSMIFNQQWVNIAFGSGHVEQYNFPSAGSCSVGGWSERRVVCCRWSRDFQGISLQLPLHMLVVGWCYCPGNAISCRTQDEG